MTENILDIIRNIKKRLRTLEQNQALRRITIPTGGKFVLPVETSAPSSPTTGQMYFDSSLSKARVYDGSSWQNL